MLCIQTLNSELNSELEVESRDSLHEKQCLFYGGEGGWGLGGVGGGGGGGGGWKHIISVLSAE